MNMKTINVPGVKGKPFYIRLSDDYFGKNDVLYSGNNVKLKVLKVFRDNWFKKLLRKLGFRTKIMHCKVIQID